MASNQPYGAVKDPLQLPQGFFDSLAESNGSPPLDRMMPQSNLPNSPPPFTGQSYMDSFNNSSARGYERSSVNNLYSKSNDQWSPSQLENSPYAVKSVDSPPPPSTANTVYTTSNNQYRGSQNYSKPPDQWIPMSSSNSNRNDTKSNDRFSSNTTHTKIIERTSSNNMFGKPSEPWTPNNSFNKTANTTISTTSSDVKMIKSADKSSSFLTERCSPRCKLGLLGFVIGLLAVGIAVAVVLVLWLRR
ncbi:hypothetical protein I4U23_030717 [Adineta vaga]|nr:hypothetical protein I4U23_030717 [Adineta vaga]